MAHQKIRYRLTFNYANRLNKQGKAPIALECRQGIKKIYFSSNVLIFPYQWDNGMIVNHENADKLMVYLVHWKNKIEEIELDSLLKGRYLTLFQLKTAVKSGLRSSATIREFLESVIKESDRKENTKRSYEYLCNEIEKDFGRLTLDDITHDWIEKYRSKLRSMKLSENTIKGRLKALRCLCSEAMKRNLLTDDPFKYITIGNLTARVGYLTIDEVEKLEALKLKGLEEKVRDLFLISCYTGLRYSDLSSLEEAIIENGILRKKMHKTNFWVYIPIDTLFWGRARRILDKYPKITELSHCCCNTQMNKILKVLAQKAGIEKNVFCHLGRKTCSNMLNQMGMPVQDISIILGHRDSRTTTRHYIFDNGERICKSVEDIFKK